MFFPICFCVYLLISSFVNWYDHLYLLFCDAVNCVLMSDAVPTCGIHFVLCLFTICIRNGYQQVTLCVMVILPLCLWGENPIFIILLSECRLPMWCEFSLSSHHEHFVMRNVFWLWFYLVLLNVVLTSHWTYFNLHDPEW